jgi:hypothetical protein
LKPEHAREVIDAFLYAEPTPPGEAGVADDLSQVGFEWWFLDGRMLVVTIHADGRVETIWSKR